MIAEEHPGGNRGVWRQEMDAGQRFSSNLPRSARRNRLASAMHYHGLTDQAPRKLFVLTTTKASVPRRPRGNEKGYRVGDTLFQFIQTKPERYFGAKRIWVGEARITITDPERTLIDGLLMPQHCGDFAEVMHAFATKGQQLDVERIIGYALQLDAATAKRLGWVLEELGHAPEQLDPLLEAPIKGYRRLDPTGLRRGPCNRRWMIQENLPGNPRGYRSEVR